MKIVICDTEWNGLEKPDKCWVIVCREVNDSEDIVHTFKRPDLYPQAFLEYAKTVDIWVGHNFIEFDLLNLQRMFPSLEIEPEQIIDTLVASRLVNFGIEGGHSVEAWAKRLKLKTQKMEIEDFSKYSEELVERCESDTLIQLSIYKFFKKYIEGNFKDALSTEQGISFLCSRMRETGFPFDKGRAEKLRDRIASRLDELDGELKTAFPPRQILVGTMIPRQVASGALHATDVKKLMRYGYSSLDLSPNKEYELYETDTFDPASLKQIITRLNEAGWKPTDKTKGHIEILKDKKADPEKLARFKEFGWKISEENLRTLPKDAPEAAQRLVERILLASRLSDLDEWLGLCRASPDGVTRVHGQFFHIGSWTHRMSHARPNMANIPIAKFSDKMSDLDVLSNDINDEMRSCWYAPDGYRLVGVDADGIQMRIFAHYVNDERLTNALISGDKKLKTDIHSIHQQALGSSCLSRDDAKTFIYAWLLGAGVAKVSEILQCSFAEAKEAVDSFLSYYPGLEALKKGRIPADAAKGYFEGLDKRFVICYNEHRVLAGYLQNGEAIVMKRAAIKWHKQLIKEKIPFKLINFVHDEWQTLVPDDQEIAKYVSDCQIQAIVDQGIELDLNCPLAGTATVKKDGTIGGYNWKDTH